MATGTLTKIESDITQAGIRTYRWAYTTSTSGIATDPSVAAKITGYLYQFRIVPSTIVVATAATVKLISGSSTLDLFFGKATPIATNPANASNIRHIVTNESLHPYLVNASIVPEITSGGVSKSGSVFVYIKEK